MSVLCNRLLFIIGRKLRFKSPDKQHTAAGWLLTVIDQVSTVKVPILPCCIVVYLQLTKIHHAGSETSVGENAEKRHNRD